MTEQHAEKKRMTPDEDFLSLLSEYLGQEMYDFKRTRNHRAWELYKEIVTSSETYHNYKGTLDQQGALERVATFSLSAAECFEQAVEDYYS
ncbi:hypothetical protein [Okeania sp. SIO2B3]|uniref:hypothetical protein n=1 Tax=Okeania sp. SIO2B3 TaxID=2607784 RepID=UPI0013BEB7EA|nr:hypothetical protein [Okeania sp. SIO2B3]NET46744.1 hypothetical protein [Okeania sp. SIO2B3]